MDKGVEMVVAVSVDALTEGEVISLALVTQLGTDPRRVQGFEKVKHLYTQNPTDGSVAMHELTREAFLRALVRRMPALAG